MLTHCPHCQDPLPFTDEQKARLEEAVSALDPGKALHLKCPRCRQGIVVAAPEKDAPSGNTSVKPPPPPDLSWLASGVYEGEEKVEDVPMALVLFPVGEQRKYVTEALEAVGYQVVVADSGEDAMEKMHFVHFASVILGVDMEGGVGRSLFHAYMRKMSMDRRRYIFYILIGKDFHTLYDLEALAVSANLVVNLSDLKHLDVILRKSIPVYEDLFGPFLEELGAYSKG